MQTANKKDYYDVLGVSRTSSDDEIKQAYRKLALQYHPDHNNDQESENLFKDVVEAYEILSNPQKKQSYDQFGHAGFNAEFEHSGFDPMDLFNSFFGHGHRQKGRNIRGQIEITLEDVLNGTKKTFTYSRRHSCKKCKGLGGQGSSCASCGGYGKVQQGSSFINVVTTCRACKGTGIRIVIKCTTCQGAGVQEKDNTIVVKIPAGIEHGTQIRLTGEGDCSNVNLPPGDLICQVIIKKHPIFVRNGTDLVCEKKISFSEACLGTVLEISTLDKSKTSIKILAGTQFNQSLRIKDKGLPRLRHSKRGDQFVIIKIEIPTKLNTKQKELLKKFRKSFKDKT